MKPFFYSMASGKAQASRWFNSCVCVKFVTTIDGMNMVPKIIKYIDVRQQYFHPEKLLKMTIQPTNVMESFINLL